MNYNSYNYEQRINPDTLTHAESTFSLSKQEAECYERAMEFEIMRIVHEAKNLGEDFLMNNLIPSVDSWINNFEPAVDISIFHFQSSVQNYIESLLNQVKTKIIIAITEWCDNSLIKDYVEPQIKKILMDLPFSFNEEVDFSQIRINIVSTLIGHDTGYNVVRINYAFSHVTRSLDVQHKIKESMIYRVKEILSSDENRYKIGEVTVAFVRDTLGCIKDKVAKELQMMVDES